MILKVKTASTKDSGYDLNQWRVNGPSRGSRNCSRQALFFLTLLLLVGCATGPGFDEQVRQAYRVGMSRDEAHALLKQAALLTAVSRPATGWSSENGDYQVGRIAFRFERDHPEMSVAQCEVYWIWRHTSVPFAMGGVWWDYLFFDSDDKLLGYHRRFLD